MTTRLTGIIVVAVAAFALVFPPAARATTEDALRRCQQGWGPDSSIGSFTLHGTNSGWTDAGLSTIASGNVVRIIGTGRVHYGGFLGSAGAWGPEGNGQVSDSRWHFPGAIKFSVAAIWNPTAAVVNFNTCTVLGSGPPTAPQKLFMGINDTVFDFGDNTGSYQVTVWVYHR